MTADDLKYLVATTFRNPEAAAHRLIGLNLPMPARWMGLLLAVSLSALLAWLSAQLFAVPGQEELAVFSVTNQPLLLATLQLAAIILAAGLMAGIGRLFGGNGSFEDALLLTVWVEAVLLLVQLGQIIVAFVMPSLAGILGVMAIALFFWLTTRFTKALHGFQNAAKVFFGLIGTALLAGFVLSFAAESIGLLPEVAP